MLSSNFDVALPPDTAFAAEVGLSGEVRGVARLEQRIAEGQRLGFTHTMAAARAREGSIPQRLKVHYYPIARVEELAKWVLGR